MTPCPKCDDIHVVKVRERPIRPWHVVCQCGYAWVSSSYFHTKREAKENWERYMREWDRNKIKEPKR